MTLVYSARLSYGGPDRLDVTRASATEGLFLAPSWAILRPALEAFRVLHGPALERAWLDYVERYTAEMRASYRKHRDAWHDLTQRERVVLVCFCTDPKRCHRAILREHLLPALGAVDAGEIEEQPIQGRLGLL